LALDEWRQRLARLDHLIKTSISTEPSTDAANEIVIPAFLAILDLYSKITPAVYFSPFRLEWLPPAGRRMT
jgi:hypothetical protein